MNLLQVRDLRINFPANGSPLAAVRGVNFEITPGEIVGLLGESGCGKTTTALSLLGLLPATATCQGSILLRDRELLRLTERELENIRGAEIALISQEPALALNPVLTIGRQIEEVLRAHKNNNRGKNWQNEVEAILATVGLSDVHRIAAAYAHQLSGGQRQRVAMAQALACRPPLVIADEPTASLDTVTQAEILELFLRLKHELGSAFLFISHSPAILGKICDRILVMYAGEIVEQGPAARVLTDPLHPYTRALLECVPARPGAERKRRAYIPGSPPDMRKVSLGCAFESRCPDRMEICTIRALEDFKPNPSRHVRCFKYGGC